MRGHHDAIGLVFVGTEDGLQDLHYELARRVVVVQQDDLVEARLLDLGLGDRVRLQDDVVAHRQLLCRGEILSDSRTKLSRRHPTGMVSASGGSFTTFAYQASSFG